MDPAGKDAADGTSADPLELPESNSGTGAGEMMEVERSASPKRVISPKREHNPLRDYKDPMLVPCIDRAEFRLWSLWRATTAEFVGTLLLTYIGIQSIIGNDIQGGGSGIGTLGVAWAFGATVFVLYYCIAGLSGGHFNPAVTFGFLVGRRISLIRALLYMIAQVLAAIVGAGIVKGLRKSSYQTYGGGTNVVMHGYDKLSALSAEVLGTFVLVYVYYSTSDAKRRARDPYVPVLAPLAIGFAVFIIGLATIPVSGTSINPARALGSATIWSHSRPFDDMWVYWLGPAMGAALAVLYHQLIVRKLPYRQAFCRDSPPQQPTP